MEKPRGLNLQMALGQSFKINEIITVTVIQIRGKTLRLSIDAPDEFKIDRSSEHRGFIEDKAIKRKS